MDKQSHNWEEFWRYSDFANAPVSWSKRRIMDILDPFARKGKKVLDAGCGSGFFSAYFCEKGMETSSVDYSDKSIKLTERITFGRARIIKADMMSEGFPDMFADKFDLIFNDGLFEHFSKMEQDRLINNLKSVLSPRGRLITFVPNLFSPWTLIRPFMMPGIEEKPFTIKQLKNLSYRNDLKIVTLGGINTLPWRISIEGPLAAYAGMLLYSISTL